MLAFTLKLFNTYERKINDEKSNYDKNQQVV